LMCSAGFENVSMLCDYAGIERIVSGCVGVS